MNSTFEDKNLVIHYIEQFLNENYNPDIQVNGEYYQTFDMNYGLAHYIAKYLDTNFPILSPIVQNEYDNTPNKRRGTRDLKKPISILNYFLADNNRHVLTFPDPDTTNMYDSIYNKYMRVHWDENTQRYKPEYNGKYMIKNDLPLFTKMVGDNYIVNDQIAFTLDYWPRKKKMCELDDLIVSYLLGRTITPKSSREDIYYVQQLLIKDRNFYPGEKGSWNCTAPDGTTISLTDTIMDFQKSCPNGYGAVPVLVTGYFDIFTEKQALMNNQNNGGVLSVHGL